jgi:hypothetical protein
MVSTESPSGENITYRAIKNEIKKERDRQGYVYTPKAQQIIQLAENSGLEFVHAYSPNRAVEPQVVLVGDEDLIKDDRIKRFLSESLDAGLFDALLLEGASAELPFSFKDSAREYLRELERKFLKTGFDCSRIRYNDCSEHVQFISLHLDIAQQEINKARAARLKGEDQKAKECEDSAKAFLNPIKEWMTDRDVNYFAPAIISEAKKGNKPYQIIGLRHILRPDLLPALQKEKISYMTVMPKEIISSSNSQHT